MGSAVPGSSRGVDHGFVDMAVRSARMTRRTVHQTSPAKPPLPGAGPKKQGPAPSPPPAWRNWLLYAGLALTFFLFFFPGGRNRATELTYTQFLNKVAADGVKSATVDPNGAVSGTLSNGTAYSTQIPVALQDNTLPAELKDHHVQIVGKPVASCTLATILLNLLPLLLLFGVFWYMGRRARSQLGTGGIPGLSGLTGSRAKLYDEERPSTTFADIAGYDGAKREVSEVVDFLKNPERYTRVGAVGPRGVLMVGPPGTGKTLLARAVAGQAGVPFFSVTGSSFVELFVGLGASRVRDLFASARKRAPSIIFIDEIDAIGQRRGGGVVSNDEREQTLNQLLAEMDGFDPASGVVVMAATNRPEILDPALLRPGRFDRQVEIPLPNLKERAAILAVHAKGKRREPDVDLNVVAGATQLATRMIREFGMSPKLGPIGFSSGAPAYLGDQPVRTRDYAEATQRVIDEEVERLLKEAAGRATALLSGHRDALDRV